MALQQVRGKFMASLPIVQRIGQRLTASCIRTHVKAYTVTSCKPPLTRYFQQHPKFLQGMTVCSSCQKELYKDSCLGKRGYATSLSEAKLKIRGIQKDISPLTTKRVFRKRKRKDALPKDQVVMRFTCSNSCEYSCAPVIQYDRDTPTPKE